jgi:PadR family transcriptional regulator, regulatory protein PadR
MKLDNRLFEDALTTILLKLLSERDKMYGYEITKKVKELTDGNRQITEGALYPTLYKLEAEGLLTASMEIIGNRQRKYYSLTKNRRQETNNNLAKLKDLLQQLQQALNLQLNIK